MTKVVQRDLYCPNCKKKYVQPVYMSVSSFLMSEEEKKLMKEGKLFKNFCPDCGKELVFYSQKEEK